MNFEPFFSTQVAVKYFLIFKMLTVSFFINYNLFAQDCIKFPNLHGQNEEENSSLIVGCDIAKANLPFIVTNLNECKLS